MQIEDYFEFLASNEIQVKGHRIGIEILLYEYLYNAQTPEEIAARFPTIALEQVYASILYYLHNQDQVKRYLAEWIAHGDRMREQQHCTPQPPILKLRCLKAEREKARQTKLVENKIS